MVGSRLFPHFFDKIHYAALSANGKGLKNYGSVAVAWRVEKNYLEGRISVHEENSFDFFNTHQLGDLKAHTPKGYSSEWQERHKIAVSKLATKIDTGTTIDEIQEMILQSGSNRSADDFIEIAIFSEDGLDAMAVDGVTLQDKPMAKSGQIRLRALKETCDKYKVKFFE